MYTLKSQVLINGKEVLGESLGESYEFILNNQLTISGCVKLDLNTPQLIHFVRNAPGDLKAKLFELQHVRVNPVFDNTQLLDKLKSAFEEIGVSVANRPSSNSMAMCFKPLGEISNSVRFYLNEEGNLVFLSPAMRPRLVYARPKY